MRKALNSKAWLYSKRFFLNDVPFPLGDICHPKSSLSIISKKWKMQETKAPVRLWRWVKPRKDLSGVRHWVYPKYSWCREQIQDVRKSLWYVGETLKKIESQKEKHRDQYLKKLKKKATLSRKSPESDLSLTA